MPTQSPAPHAGFGALDWAVLGAYLALLIVTGVVLSRRKPRTADEYFTAQHRMPTWAVAISLLATVQSAATFVGVPQLAYAGDLTYLSATIGAVLASIILIFVFIPAYYRLGVSTPYQLLDSRFGPGARYATTATYMLGRILASGARIFIGAVPFSIAVFGDAKPSHVAAAIAAFMVFGVLYTLAGGVRSVIWTDVLQVAVYLGAAVAILVALRAAIPADTSQIIQALAHPPSGDSKLTVLKLGIDASKPALGFDPAQEFTLLTAIGGLMLLNLAALGTDQDLVQRTLTCRNAAQAGWSVLGGTLIGIPVVCVFLAIGLLLHIYYQRPDLMGRQIGLESVGGSTRVFVNFSLTQMPAGLAGLMIAGMLAAGPAGINSSLNSMASALVGDVYRPLVKDRSERHYLLVGRLAVVFWGVVLGAFAALCAIWQDSTGQTLIGFALSVMTFAYAGLLGVFLTALLTRRGNTTSTIVALVVGGVTVFAFRPGPWAWIQGSLSDWFGAKLPAKIEYPWALVLGTGVAFLACWAGAPKRRAPVTVSPT